MRARRIQLFAIMGLAVFGALVSEANAQHVQYGGASYNRRLYYDRRFYEVFDDLQFYRAQVALPLVAKGDLNDDGFDDFVSASLYGHKVVIHLCKGGEPKRSLRSRSRGYSTGMVLLDTKAVSSVMLEDLDNDSKQDLVVTGRFQDSDDLAILYGDGAGGFSQLMMHRAHTAPIATFTFKRHSHKRPWLSCVNYRSRDIDIYKPVGRRGYERVDRHQIGPKPDSVVKVEDPKTSTTTLYMSSVDDGSVWKVVLNSRGKKIVERTNPFSLKSEAHGLSMFLLPNNKDPKKPPSLTSIVGLKSVSTGNGNRVGAVQLYAPRGDGEFRRVGTAGVHGKFQPLRMGAADLLGDGKPEVVVVYGTDDQLWNTNAGNLVVKGGGTRPLRLTNSVPSPIRRGRNSRNRYPRYTGYLMTVQKQDADGKWKTIVETRHRGMPTPFLFSDIDGNGLLDIVSARYPNGSSISWQGMVRTKDGLKLMPEQSLR